MLDRLRVRLAAYFTALGNGAAKVGLSPSGWTLVGVIFSFMAAAAFWSSGYRGEALGALLVLASGFFDIVDGAVARSTGKVSRRGAFLDSNLDRVSEVAIYFGILLGGLADPRLVLAALSLSLLVSYARARADALGVKLSGVGVGERSERLLVLAGSALLGLVGYGVALVAVLAGITFLQRFAKVLASVSD